MFTPRVIVIKMSKMAHLLCLLLMKTKICHSLGKVFNRNLWLIGFGVTVREIEVRYQKKNY